MANRRHSPLVGQTWHHASTPAPIDTLAPDQKGFSPLPGTTEPLIPGEDGPWSGDWKNLFTDTNSSDWHGQSAASTVSWSDELENESTQRLSEQFEQLESVLYEDSSSEDQLPNPNLALECKQWKERFPHIRAVGVAIKSSSDYSSCEIDVEEEEENEEVLAADGNYVEFPIQHVTDDNRIKVCSPNLNISEEDVRKYKEKVKNTVLDEIFSKIWPNIIKKIDPVFKKILERNKLAVQPVPRICVENEAVQSNVDLRFSNNEKYLRVSPEPCRENSAKKHILNSALPISLVKSSVRDCPVPQITTLSIKNSPPKSATKCSSAIKLVQPPSIVFPSAETLLSPIQQETRNFIHSARVRKKLSQKNNCSSGKTKRSPQQPEDNEQEEGRFCSKDEGRTGMKFNMKKSTRGYWNRHCMLPPISSKENIKTLSATTKRSTSALQKLGKADLETRPNTSLPNKSGITLLPLNEGNKKKSQMDLAQEWLEKQLSSNNSKHHLSTHFDSASRWRAHHLSHRK